jgi:hypothetical protein
MDPAIDIGERPIDIGERRELFVDYLLIECMTDAALKLHEPVSGGVAIRLDQPWEGPANGPVTVFQHDGRYLMYYRAMTLTVGDDSGVLCVATSDDGATWVKPDFGLVERAGESATNVMVESSGTPMVMAAVWLDEGPGVPAHERIKALTSETLEGEKHTAFADPKGPKRLVVWCSADGFTFSQMARQPEIVSDLKNCFDGGNTMFWSEEEKAWVLYYRFMDGYRSMARTTSKDFTHWTDPVPMSYGETQREQFYTNNTVPYFRAPHQYVALAARFMEGRRVVTDEQAERIGLHGTRGHFYGNDCADAVLLTSRAGTTTYDRTFMESFIRPGPGAQNWVSRTNYPLTGILPCGEQQMMTFVARHYMQDTWHIERLLLRVDGFASVNAPWAGGEMLTKPLVFSGQQLEINYRTGAAGSVRVEVQDVDGLALPGYGLDDCTQIIGDEISRIVTWTDGADVAALAGREVRLRWVLRDADLFSLRFVSTASVGD